MLNENGNKTSDLNPNCGFSCNKQPPKPAMNPKIPPPTERETGATMKTRTGNPYLKASIDKSIFVTAMPVNDPQKINKISADIPL